MKNIELVTHITAFSLDELERSDRELVEQAIMSTANAYSPYSHFSVGAWRQVGIEIEQRYSRSMRVLLYGEDTVLAIDSASDLLPLSFAGDDMNPQATA